ncbi:hypothetical protein BDL97_03G076300 [Sphagnum fallax]|nr:hypothetical protein BDL97_03G076300 [Sphagnum fallax]
MASLPLPSSPAFLPSSSSSSSSHSLPITVPSHFYLRQRSAFCNSLISQRIRSSSFGEARGKEVRRRCGRAVEDIRDLEQRQDMGETTTTSSSTVLTVASSSGTAAATVGSTDMYAAIPTLPIAAALAAAGSETAELNGGTCGLLDRPDKKQVCLFYCSETEDLARRIAAETDSIELKSIRWGTFADGFPNLFVPNAHGIRSQHVAFLASFSSPGVIFEQLSIIYALPRMFVSSFTLVLPFFPTGTLERMEDEGDIATAFTLARILSNIPISRGGPTSLVIFDIHALQERFYFGDNVLPCFESGIPLLKHRLHQLPDANNISIAFPDEGAWKRFHKQLQHFPTIICTKVRDGNNRIVRLKEGEPQGRHVVIVDDLVQSGGTLIECQKLLGANGASKVSAYVTHAVFPKRSWERFEHDNGVLILFAA